MVSGKLRNKMKKIKFVLISLIVVGATLLSSCKKEARIEKNLWNKGGEWNVESIYAKQVSSDPSDNFEETVFNYGTYTFNKDGSGRYTITVDGDFEEGSFTYSNTEEKITFIISNQALIFDILEWEKGKMTISITDNFTSNGNAVTYTETLNLRKK